MKVSDIMTKDVVTISPKASIKAAAREMRDNSIECLVVMSGDEFLGTITDKDLIRILASRKIHEPETISVGYAMENSRVYTTPDADIGKVMEKMSRNHIKKLAVLEGKRLVGIITSTDLARSCPGFTLKK